MFPEDIIADILLNIVRIIIVIVTVILTILHYARTGKLSFLPAGVAVAVSILLGFAQPHLADFIFVTFMR